MNDLERFSEGLEGEEKIRNILNKTEAKYFQADLIVEKNGKYSLLEVKHQEMFEAPPFDGHGLPRWQIISRLKFQNSTGIRAILFIVDKKSNIIYYQFMDKLMEGRKFQTTGSNPRIIFPLENFNILGEEI